MVHRTLLGLATFATLAAFPSASPAPISRSAHISYEGCPAPDVTLTVTVPHRSYAPRQPVTYRVSLHNLSGQACGPVRGLGPGRIGILFGPCGMLPLAIEDARGLEVYPGPQAILCPALLGPTLPPHHTLSETGTWDQMQGGGRPARQATLVPRGTYHLFVGSKVSVPIVLP